MSEPMNEITDPNARKLSNFTPDGSLLDRDELMFAAGRASVQTSRFWKWLAGVLLISQALTLALWFTERSPAPSVPHLVPVVTLPSEPFATEPESPSPPDRSTLISQRRLFRDDLETGYRPITTASRMSESPVIFTAHSRLNLD